MEPTREYVDAQPGLVLLEFGASWCGFCQAARSMIDDLVGDHPELRHIRIEDGKGKPLGRSFAVKLWPTLVLLRDGKVVARLVRPTSLDALRTELQRYPAATLNA